MERPTDPRSFPRDHRYGRTVDRSVSPCIRQGTKLRDILMSEKPNLSYAHFHHMITRDPDDTLPGHLSAKQSQMSDKMTLKEDEVVRYMSKLPSYLEKGKNYQEKPLNVGVIDWKRLEKWHYSQKHMPHKHTGYSPSSSNTSCSSTTDGSSTHSGRGHNNSPAHQTTPSFSQQFSLESFPKGRHVHDAKSSATRGHSCSPSPQMTFHRELQSHTQKLYGREGEFQDIDISHGHARGSLENTVSAGNNLSGQAKVLGTLQGCDKKELKSMSATVHRPSSGTSELAAPCKGKTQIEVNKSAEETLMLQEAKLNVSYCDYFESEKSGIMIKLKDQSESSCSTVTILSDSTMNGQSLAQPGWKIISGKSDGKDPSSSETDGNKLVEPAGSHPWNAESVKSSSQASPLPRTKVFTSPSKISSQGVKAPPQPSFLLPFPARRFSSPSRGRNSEDKKPIAGLTVAGATKSLDELDARKSSESISKARNPSPIRRLSFAMSKMIRNAGSRENSPLRRSSSTEFVAKSGSEGARASIFTDNPSSERSSSNTRGRSSPLRRLFDPLLKSRASNSPEPSKKHSSSGPVPMKSSHDLSDSGARHSTKIKLRGANGTLSFCDPHPNLKNESSVQALLQVSFKNGLPLFTFAIDNESNILAATVRKSYVPGKGHYTWSYTFFTVGEIKRKSGIWLNQGGKGDGHGCVPNVVAQMKVTDTLGSPFTKHENAGSDISREFDLFAVDVGHGDEHGTDFHPTNELAAIVVKLPRVTNENPSKDGQSAYGWLDSSLPFFKENLPERVSCADSDDNLLNHRDMLTPNFSTTVILPSGVHTIPSRGEISTLAQRWKSGGSCDCGGWDLGCQLRVYKSRSEYKGKMGSSATCLDEHKIQLFSQVGQDNQLMLSLTPFKERIYSVEFKPSLSLLQAFAVCISFIDCRRPAELSGPSIAAEKISNEVSVFEVPVQIKTSSYSGEVPTRYISYPPHSPVGRV